MRLQILTGTGKAAALVKLNVSYTTSPRIEDATKQLNVWIVCGYTVNCRTCRKCGCCQDGASD